jgi:PAS domain S-box-containing protein
MNTLLKLQLKKVYGKDFDLSKQDEKFQKLLSLVEEAYDDYEEEEKLLENILNANAQELEESNALLLEQQELLKSVENSMDDAIFYKDLNDKYIGCNKKFADLLGYSEDEIIGKTYADFVQNDTASDDYKTNKILFKNKCKTVYKHWIIYKGKKAYFLTSKTPLINKEGDLIGLVGISRDITHEYELQQEIEHKNIMLIQQNKFVSMGEMIANIAHQWRQPLNTLGIIIQKIGILYQRKKLDAKTMDENITESMLLIQEMSQTIDDFRNFFDPKRVVERFEVKEAIFKSYTMIKLLIIANNIDFRIDIKEQYFLKGYKNEFFQVILNLLNNAIEALVIDKIISPKIVLSISTKEDDIIINIYDNGNGISKETMQKIFNPYFTTKENGTGLGLYMSKVIIEDHMKGKISITTNILGTTFSIKLPNNS